MIPARILGTGRAWPRRKVGTRELLEATRSSLSVQELERRTGIEHRYWADRDDTFTGLAVQALRAALDTAELPASALKRVIFVSSTGGDFLIPATANAVLERLEIFDSCDCFDLNNACTGFLTALDLAARCVATQSGPVGIVAVEMLSKFAAPENPRPYFVFADAAAAAIVGDAEGTEGVLASSFGNDGSHRGGVFMDHPGMTRQHEELVFAASNKEITEIALNAVVSSARRVLERAGIALRDIDWVVPHQPNGFMFEQIIERLGVDPQRVIGVVKDHGSIGAASIPFSLDTLMRKGDVRPGARLLMAAVGAGMSHGAMLYRAP